MKDVNLYIRLNPQDLQLIQHAIPQATAPRDPARPVHAGTIAHAALGAICRAILDGGYRPQPVAAYLRREDPQLPLSLPEGVIKVQLG
jgi:hypothetical protein